DDDRLNILALQQFAEILVLVGRFPLSVLHILRGGYRMAGVHVADGSDLASVSHEVLHIAASHAAAPDERRDDPVVLKPSYRTRGRFGMNRQYIQRGRCGSRDARNGRRASGLMQQFAPRNLLTHRSLSPLT